MIFRLAKIVRTKQFWQANDPRAVFCGVANEIDGAHKIFWRLRTAAHLNESEVEGSRCETFKVDSRDVSASLDMTEGA